LQKSIGLLGTDMPVIGEGLQSSYPRCSFAAISTTCRPKTSMVGRSRGTHVRSLALTAGRRLRKVVARCVGLNNIVAIKSAVVNARST